MKRRKRRSWGGEYLSIYDSFLPTTKRKKREIIN